MKREFLMLAHKYERQYVGGWLMSEKLDGMRAFWDGGISRGIQAASIPYSNIEKDNRLVNAPIATGLWSRYGKVIHAPGWWLDKLPKIPLDGELWIGHGQWEGVASCVKKHVPGPEWSGVEYRIFDVPSLWKVLEDGCISVVNFKKTLLGCTKWIQATDASLLMPAKPFEWVYEALHESNIENDVVVVHPQITLPLQQQAAREAIDEYLDRILISKGEGVVLRAPQSVWTPERSHNMLKYKPINDAEGIVVGYTWGLGKLLGMMGALIVEYEGKRLELSGFTNAERQMTDYENPQFPIGSVVTFKYRELSNAGIPKEARFFRKSQE